MNLLVEAVAQTMGDQDFRCFFDNLESVVFEDYPKLKEKVLKESYTDADYSALGKEFVKHFMGWVQEHLQKTEEDSESDSEDSD